MLGLAEASIHCSSFANELSIQRAWLPCQESWEVQEVAEGKPFDAAG